MKLKALITTLVLGSSSVALAHPVSTTVVRDQRAPIVQAQANFTLGHTHRQPTPVYQPTQQPAPIYQPIRQPAPIYQPTRLPAPYYAHTSWITLGGVNQIVDGEMAFRVNRFGGERFSQLKLQSDAGKSLIYRVMIEFANGRTQTIEVNQYLTAKNPAITLDLNGRARAIAKVTVVGRNARQSAYRVLAI
ncbi:MAG TPA: hypothetical protein VNO30_04950 [Kofleriaceae bacterium]|nr:hypothetical protein [Kofleriaceae bacterium]